MNNLNYFRLGTLKPEVVSTLESMILPHVIDKPYHWINFEQEQRDYFKKIFNNPNGSKIRAGQKALISAPNSGFRIHKDEPETKCALNVVVSCNPTDWVRWYDTQYIRKTGKLFNADTVIDENPMRGLNVQIMDYDNVPYIDELTDQKVGDVYIVNTTKYHSFKSVGSNKRIVIQTKFLNCPTLENLAQDLDGKIFSGLFL
jgi:hypothetical protein